MTFFVVTGYINGDPWSTHCATKAAALRVVKGMREAGLERTQVGRVKLDSSNKATLLGALNCAANGNSYRTVGTVELLDH